MKILLLIRHAKSSWNDLRLSDFERPLNNRGKEEAPQMAARLRRRGIVPDYLLSSPAKRAKHTARYFAEAYGFEKTDIVLIDNLYEPTIEAFTAAVAGVPAEKTTVLLFAHNPGITAYVNLLTQVRIDEMPTCGVFAVQAHTSNWSQFADAEKQFLFFDAPGHT